MILPLLPFYAQRYGAPPVAHATGGLVDTIVDCDSKLETGTGFLFEAPTADLLYAMSTLSGTFDVQDEVVTTSLARRALAVLRISFGLTFLWAFFDKTFGFEQEVSERTVDAHVVNLRRKIEANPKEPQIIRTERGLGYVFDTRVKAV